MRKIRQNTGIWEYLQKCGALENGTEEQIKEARRAYKKKYILEYKRRQRAETREFTILLKKEELKKAREAAKERQMTTVRFLKTAALAYMNKTYIVPDREQVAHLEQALIQVLNEIQAIAKRNKILFGLNPLAIEKRISRMEEVINDTLRNPPAINPTILSVHSNNHDRENKDKEEANLQTVA